MSNEVGARSIPEFCAAHSISRATFYNHISAMPRTIRVGARRLVTIEAERAWRRERERREAKANERKRRGGAVAEHRAP
jgi:predicted DNA-binding transcriptional regulator AlpA